MPSVEFESAMVELIDDLEVQPAISWVLHQHETATNNILIQHDLDLICIQASALECVQGVEGVEAQPLPIGWEEYRVRLFVCSLPYR